MEVCSRFLCQILIYFTFIGSVFSSLKDVTRSVGLGGESLGTLAAFGDFNADKEADLFFINNYNDKSKVNVYSWDSKDEKFEKISKAVIELEQVFITNVIPGDFDSDGHLDVVLSYYNKTLPSYRDQTFVKLFLGRDGQFELNSIELDDPLKDQPTIVDYDGDLQPDLLADKASDQKRYWWKYNLKNNSFASQLIELTKPKLLPLSRPHSCAFLDVNGDYTPDLFITTKDASSPSVKFEVWLNKDGVLALNEEDIYSQPEKVAIGQSTFADIDSDGLADHILPACSGQQCKKSEIHVYSRSKKKWSLILSSKNNQDYKWRFVKNTTEDNIPLMTIRIGDYNMDGFPDAAMVVEIWSENDKAYKRRVVLLENVKCGGGSGCYNGRKFSFDVHSVVYSIENPVAVGFFDLYENGVLDLMVISSDDEAKTYQTHAIQNNVYSDTCFLKVIVLGGSCYSDCRSGVTPYGVNQAGPFVKYVTTGLNGDTEQASATQLSQAAYFALQPPYTVFGLGRTPNFVEKLIIGLPRSKTSPARVRTWTAIIPNSQVIIIPVPPDHPNEWKSKLLVTPSKLVLLTGGALLATCVFIGTLVAVLHWKEKKEDRREKQEAAHKFHFDAM